MKQVIDITTIACTIMHREAIPKLGMPRTKIYVHLKALLQHVPLFQSRKQKALIFLSSANSLTKLFELFWFV